MTTFNTPGVKGGNWNSLHIFSSIMTLWCILLIQISHLVRWIVKLTLEITKYSNSAFGVMQSGVNDKSFFRWGTRRVPLLYRWLFLMCVWWCYQKKKATRLSILLSKPLYWGQAGATSGVQSAEHVYTECTVLFSLALTRYLTYFARLQFFLTLFGYMFVIWVYIIIIKNINEKHTKNCNLAG